MYINSLVLMDNIFRWIMNEIKFVNCFFVILGILIILFINGICESIIFWFNLNICKIFDLINNYYIKEFFY